MSPFSEVDEGSRKSSKSLTTCILAALYFDNISILLVIVRTSCLSGICTCFPYFVTWCGRQDICRPIHTLRPIERASSSHFTFLLQYPDGVEGGLVRIATLSDSYPTHPPFCAIQPPLHFFLCLPLPTGTIPMSDASPLRPLRVKYLAHISHVFSLREKDARGL